MSRAQGLTRNQTTVLGALTQAGHPLGAYDILALDKVRRQGVKAPLTIYRALKALVDKGLVHRVESLNAYLACEHAPHKEQVAFMICRTCRGTTELPLEECLPDLAARAREAGFFADAISVEISGRCPRCAQRPHGQ